MSAPAKPDPLKLLLEWAAIREERRSVPSASTIHVCEESDERNEGPCYGRGRLYYGPDSCDPCRERMARFNRIKSIAGRLRGVEARMVRAAARVRAAQREEEKT